MNQPNYIKTCSRMLALVTAASIAMSTGVVAERSDVAKAPQPVEENSSVVMQADVSTSSSEENLSSLQENRETIEEESLEIAKETSLSTISRQSADNKVMSVSELLNSSYRKGDEVTVEGYIVGSIPDFYHPELAIPGKSEHWGYNLALADDPNETSIKKIFVGDFLSAGLTDYILEDHPELMRRKARIHVILSSSRGDRTGMTYGFENIQITILPEEAKGITATFDYNEDAPEGVVAPDAITVKDGKITLPMPKEMKKGEKEFICWKKLNKKTGYIEGSWQPGDAVTLTEDTTFVGKWRKPAWAVRLTFKDEKGNIIKDDATLATFKASLNGDNGVVIKSSNYAISSLLIYDEDSDKYIPRGEYRLNIDLSGSQYSFVSATLDNRYYDQKKHEMITEHTAFNPASEKMTIPRPGVKTEIDTNFLVTVVVKKNSSVKATFEYDKSAPQGFTAPDAISATDGKVTLPLPKETVSGDTQFIGWKDADTKAIVQPGMEVSLEQSKTFIGVWQKAYWSVNLTLKDSSDQNITEKAYPSITSVTLKDKQGRKLPGVYDKEKNVISFYKAPETENAIALFAASTTPTTENGYLLRGTYELQLNFKDGSYQTVSATLNGEDFNLTSGTIAVPEEKMGVTADDTQELVIMLSQAKQSSVKATFEYDKNAPQGFTAPDAISATDGKVTLPLPKETVSGDTQFIGWKDADTKAIVQPGMEVSLEQSKTFIGVWQKAYWSVNLTLKDSSDQNITEKAYPSITSVTLKDKQGRKLPGVYDKEKNVISFYKAPETENAIALFAASTTPTTENGYLLRGTYELQLNFKDGSYQTVSATLNGEDFNLTSGTIAVPEGKMGVTADDTQELVIMLSQSKQSSDSSSSASSSDDASSDSSTQGGNHTTPKDHSDTSKASSSEKTPPRSESSIKTGDASQSQASNDSETTHEQEPIEQPTASDTSEPTVPNEEEHPTESETEQAQEENARNTSSPSKDQKAPASFNLNQKGVSPKTGDITLLSFTGTAVLAAGAFVASKRKQR